MKKQKESIAMTLAKSLKKKVFILSIIAILEFALLIGVVFCTISEACIPETQTEFITEIIEKTNPSGSMENSDTKGHVKRKHNFAKKKG